MARITPASHSTRYAPSTFGDHLSFPTSLTSANLVQAFIITRAGLIPVGTPLLPHQFYRKDLAALLENSQDGLIYFAALPTANGMVSIRPEAN